jgi:hypothetical protein
VSTAGTQQLKTRLLLALRPDDLDWTWTLIGLDEGSSAQWPVGRSFLMSPSRMAGLELATGKTIEKNGVVNKLGW